MALRLEDDDAVSLGVVTDFHVLLDVIDEAMPNDAVLVLENTGFAPDVDEFLAAREPGAAPDVERGTLWPRSTLRQLPLEGSNLQELRELADRHAAPEVASHLTVYRGDGVLLTAFDAGDGEVRVNRRLPSETLAALRRLLAPVIVSR